jgi:cell division protease FtsH
LEECRNVVTIATTNWLDTLDTALKDRPSRFDLVVAFEPPAYAERLSYIDYLARRIPVPVPIRERLASRAKG